MPKWSRPIAAMMFSILTVSANQTFALRQPAKARKHAHLIEPGWNPVAKKRLEELIDKKRGQQLPVVFDFDNTLVCRDIGEATFAALVRDGLLSKDSMPKGITPLDVRGDVIALYDAFLEATSHHVLDKAPYLNAYGWLVQIMAGLSPKQIIDATKKAYANGIAEKDLRSPTSLSTISVSDGKPAYELPYFYPEMVELVSELIKADYDVWVISASNAWTVRYMVTEVLNQKLHDRGAQKGIKSDHVIGITTLLKGPGGKLYKDPFLTLENSDYALLKDAELAKYALSTQIVYPMSSYFGKAANIMQWIQKTPYLVAGDSPNDHGMLAMAENKLWITRLEKPTYQAMTTELMGKTDPKSWIFQPTLTKKSSGFVASAKDLIARTDGNPKIAESVYMLRQKSQLRSF